MIIFGNACLFTFKKRINIKIKQLYKLANAVLVIKILICLLMNERQCSDETLNNIYIYTIYITLPDENVSKYKNIREEIYFFE